MPPQRVISAACHCGAFNLSLDASELTFPQLDTFCHCTSCRRRTGQLAVFPLGLPSTFKPSDEQRAALTAYTTHRGIGPVTSHFCSTCGAKVFFQTSGFNLSTGLIKGGIDGLIELFGHHWVGDTKDGGFADMILPADNPRYFGGDEDAGLFVREQTQLKEDAAPAVSEHLPMHCDCGAFSVFVSRPAPTLPLPKNCYWYRPPIAEDTGLPTRFMATYCGCTSCRTTTGSMLPAHPWAQIPFVDLHVKDEESGAMKPFLRTTHAPEGAEAPESGIALGTTIPGLKLYRSSAENARYHCSTCGATVLYFDSSRPWLGTWAAGLVDDPKGVRAESWLSWWTGQEGHPMGAVHCYDEAHAHDARGAEGLKGGLEVWGRKVGQRK
ncbi:hypothetical protein D9619_006838 [Psilocybe cf. subviscida]|uniref:CENP-V/GFA domain-containing protein n=1 Tax=Psilocybe cf. subviscida TaxID=2480587 RepID=A0A8H5EY49_9AGAR|nr:hypothetical protein D9619_006838 [Psilocybe cf. subviscida]